MTTQRTRALGLLGQPTQDQTGLLGFSPEAAAYLGDAARGLFGRIAGAIAAPVTMLPQATLNTARQYLGDYQTAMQGWREATPPPGVTVTELDGRRVWRLPNGSYRDPDRVNIAGVLPVGQNERTGEVSLEAGRLLPLIETAMASEIGSRMAPPPRDALRAGGTGADKADDAIRLTRADPGAGKPVSVDFRPARDGTKFKHYQETAKNLGLSLDDASYAKLKADVDDLAKLRSERRMAQINTDPLKPGHIQRDLEAKRYFAVEDAKQAAERARIAKRLSFIDDVEASGLWRKDFIDRARLDAKYGSGAEIAKANMEAVPRAMGKEGWTVRHVSQAKSGRASSRYLVAPDGKFQVRLSDHHIPETPQRLGQYMSGGPSWNEDIVLRPMEHPRDVIDKIRALYARFLADME